MAGVTLTLGTRPVLRNVSLDIVAGEVVALVGPNGAGKSSLLRVMAGLLEPNEGDVRIDGRRLSEYSTAEIGVRIAYLAQSREVHWPMAVGAIVGLGRLPHRGAGMTTTARDDAAVAVAMAQMGVTELASRPVLALSGGEQARVLMARALAQEPRLLIADEPTAGLDLAHQLELMQVLRKRSQTGAACVVAMHDLGMAARFADIIVLLAHGHIVASGVAKDVLTHERIAAVYGVDVVVTTVDEMPVFVPRMIVTPMPKS